MRGSPGCASPGAPTSPRRSLQLPARVRAAFEGDVVRPLLPRGRGAGFQRLRARVLRYRPPPGPGRGQRRAGGSSPNPLLCLGEVKKGKVSGFHNWIRFYLLEKQGVVNYFSHNFNGPVRAPGGVWAPHIAPHGIGGAPPAPSPLLPVRTENARGKRGPPKPWGRDLRLGALPQPRWEMLWTLPGCSGVGSHPADPKLAPPAVGHVPRCPGAAVQLGWVLQGGGLGFHRLQPRVRVWPLLPLLPGTAWEGVSADPESVCPPWGHPGATLGPP